MTEHFEDRDVKNPCTAQTEPELEAPDSRAQKALNSAAPFFVDLPQPVATAKTDAEGRFQLTIPDKGEYVLVASAERTVFN